MTLPTQVRVIWTGTNASIPTDWSEDTDFTDRFFQVGDFSFTASSTGGSANHNHTADSHTHTGNAHTHNVSGGSAANTTTFNITTTGFPGMSPVMQASHTHSSTVSNSSTIIYGSTTATIDTTEATPPHVKIIYISPDDGSQEIPDDAVCFTDTSTLPTGFSKTDGNGGTPNLDGDFLKGVDSNGDNSDLGSFGSATHTHSQSHTHSTSSHEHTAKSVTTSGTGVNQTGFGFQPLVFLLNHHHVSLRPTTLTDVSTNTTSTTAVSSEPGFIELLGIQNTSGSATTPNNVVVIWKGDISDVPNDWRVVESAINKQVKITTSDGSIGDTGGSNTHTHTIDHGHTHGSHNHAVIAVIVGSGSAGSGATAVLAIPFSDPPGAHTHTWTVTSTTPTMQDTNMTMSSDDVRYLFRTVLLIKKVDTPTVFIKGATILGAVIK